MKLYIRLSLILPLFLTGFLTSAFAAASPEEGKKLFEANCQACHAIDKDVVGPALKEIDKRRDMAWLIKWVKNPQAVLASGDAYANDLLKKYNNMQMTAFGSLSDDQIKSIFAFVKAEEGKTPSAAAPKSDGKTASSSPDASPSDEGALHAPVTFYVLSVLAVLLLIIIFVLRSASKKLADRQYAQNPDQRPENHGKSFYSDSLLPWVGSWNPTVAVVVFIMVFGVIFSYLGFRYANAEIGVQKGYSPKQPIAYSHKIHAGDYKIDCRYCHSTAEKSKQASVPSGSTCMNCHNWVTAKDKYNGKVSPEILKLYKAMGFNPDTRKYDGPQTPIKWIRIHNLPDHATFNHSTHVKVGKVACQKCHGEIQTMDVVYQRNTLQMGWCINCHRESNVDMASNPYYEQLHEKFKKEGKTQVKVANNGGLECSKCHF